MPYRQLAPYAAAMPSMYGRPAPPPPLREQDRLLPMANVARVMAAELPADAKIAKEAKVLMQELMSEFICFVTAEASDISLAKGHKAITIEDCLAALESIDIGFLVPAMLHATKILRPMDSKNVGKASMSFQWPTPIASPVNTTHAIALADALGIEEEENDDSIQLLRLPSTILIGAPTEESTLNFNFHKRPFSEVDQQATVPPGQSKHHWEAYDIYSMTSNTSTCPASPKHV